jgi:hypothetical protein
MIPMRLAVVKATGKRYIVRKMEYTRVRCWGEVKRVTGFSSQHGDDKLFILDKVDILNVDRTEELLKELWMQNEEGYKAYLKELTQKELEREREEFIHWTGAHYELTDKSRKHFRDAGYEIALDNPKEDDSMLQDMAGDLAAYDMELSRFGITEGHGNHLRQAAADYVYEGMLKARKEKQSG